MRISDTIYALSSGAGKAGISVLRVSGPDALSIAGSLTSVPVPSPRENAFRTFHHEGEEIDQGLLLIFKAPSSFTGDDLVEFHVHGSRAVINKFFEAFHSLGARPAEPGEFTRIAFENGKFDLTAAEGIADLIDAETEGQRKQALRQMEGSLGVLYEGWREKLLTALAFIEAEIDFPDEELPDDLSDQILDPVNEVSQAILQHLDDGHRGERLRSGVQVAIIGSPNVGKSSLINALAQREVAIVSDISGTTRDVLEVHLDLKGIPVTLADTAGLRESEDLIEQEGIKRARARAESADIRVFVIDHSASDLESKKWEVEPQETDLFILNKIDLMENEEKRDPSSNIYFLSAKTGKGLTSFIDDLSDRVAEKFAPTEVVSLTRSRHRLALEECQKSLGKILSGEEKEVSLRAEDLRLAVRSLGRITGRTDVEDMLDKVFSGFCIGK